MTKILMVCLGNICRSPLAQGILESKLDRTKFYVDSAGTANYHVGATPDHRSVTVAKKYGIDISTQSARQFKSSDFNTFDIIYAMDTSNLNHLQGLAQTTADTAKLKLILKESNSTKHTNVPDPYYGDFNDFDEVFKLLDHVCDKIATKLSS